MSQVIQAIYEDGVFRPEVPVLGVSPGQRVWVTVDEPDAFGQFEQKETELIRRLEIQGLVEKPSAQPAPAGFRPLQVPGPGISETILAERR
jgi:predicted DNA-binding antitoxin AbrB/MazE fold protein